jgi:hypothetical protein
MRQLPFFQSETKTSKPLDLIYSDVMCADDVSKWISLHADSYWWLFLVHIRSPTQKNEGPQAVRDYVPMVSNLFERKPKILWTDNGKEYANEELKQFLKKEGILHQFTVPYTPQQNSVAEKKNCSLIEMAKCMLLDTGLYNRFWG